MRYDPTLVDRTSNFFVLCTNLKVYIIIHSGRSLARIFMKKRSLELLMIPLAVLHIPQLNSMNWK